LLDDAAAGETPFQAFDLNANPSVGFPPHPNRTRRQGIDNWPRATEPLSQAVRLQKDSSLFVPKLALIGGVAKASAAEITAHSLKRRATRFRH